MQLLVNTAQSEVKMALIAKNLYKVFDKKIVVDDVSIKVEPGQIIGLLGPNGAGKTTSFYMVVGILQPDTGSIILDKELIGDLPMYVRARKGIAYLPQEPSVFRKLTVKENLMAIIETLNISHKQGEEILDELLKDFGISHLINNKAYSLSGGERRRVEISRSLILKPKFILLDEPFAGIDPIAVKEIQGIIKKLAQRNIGVLITDHNVRETLGIVDYAYILKEGKIKVEGSSDDIINNDDAKAFYLGKEFRL